MAEHSHHEDDMPDELRTAGNWAKELGVPEKKLKDGIKAAAVQPDAKKGACAYYTRTSAEKALRAAQ